MPDAQDLESNAREARRLFHLRADGAFLNHGSFGACPHPVLSAQSDARLHVERQPDVFYREELMPRLRALAADVGRRIGAEGTDLAFAVNATEAVNAVLRWFPFAPGDEILIADHGYGAVARNVRAVAKDRGAAVAVAKIPAPATQDAVVESVLAAVTTRTRLAILDTVTSPSALALPLDRLIPALQARGVRVLVDGAHGIGLVAIDCRALGADWLTTNAHKWAYAPRGTALLFAAPGAARLTFPLAVSEYHAEGFPNAFDYTGTRDVSAWLAIGAALDFLDRVASGGVAHMAAIAELFDEATAEFGAIPAQADGWRGPMRAYLLPTRRPATPEDPPAFLRAMWDRHGVQIASNVIDGRLLLRLSAQIYVAPSDVARLVAALREDGWPGR